MKSLILLLFLSVSPAVGEWGSPVSSITLRNVMEDPRLRYDVWIDSMGFVHAPPEKIYRENGNVTYVVEYKEKIDPVAYDVWRTEGMVDAWWNSSKEFETRLNAIAWIKKRKQAAINGEDYPIRDVKIWRVTKEEVK